MKAKADDYITQLSTGRGGAPTCPSGVQGHKKVKFKSQMLDIYKFIFIFLFTLTRVALPIFLLSAIKEGSSL